MLWSGAQRVGDKALVADLGCGITWALSLQHLERDFCYAFVFFCRCGPSVFRFPAAWTSHSMALGVGRIGGQCLTLSWSIASI